jgi:hypothetical protein
MRRHSSSRPGQPKKKLSVTSSYASTPLAKSSDLVTTKPLHSTRPVRCAVDSSMELAFGLDRGMIRLQRRCSTCPLQRPLNSRSTPCALPLSLSLSGEAMAPTPHLDNERLTGACAAGAAYLVCRCSRWVGSPVGRANRLHPGPPFGQPRILHGGPVRLCCVRGLQTSVISRSALRRH